jgi:hypothetical protein
MPAGLAHTAEKNKELNCDVLGRGRAELMGALLASPVLSLHGGSGACSTVTNKELLGL